MDRPDHSGNGLSRSSDLASLDWRQLQASHVWRDVLVPFLIEYERETLSALQAAEPNSTTDFLPLVGRLQAIAAIRAAPETFLAKEGANAFFARHTPALRAVGEDSNGRRRKSLLDRFRRGLRSGG